MQLKVKNVQKVPKMQVFAPDQLKDVSNGAITVLSFLPDEEHIEMHIFYHFDWYQPGKTWF